MNLADLQSFNAAAQTANEALRGCTTSIGGAAPVAAACGGLRRDQRFGEAGAILFVDTITFRVGKSLVAQVPAPETSITWQERGRTFRIERVGETVDADPCWTFYAYAYAV